LFFESLIVEGYLRVWTNQISV